MSSESGKRAFSKDRLGRKVKAANRQQEKFDAETERMIKQIKAWQKQQNR